MTSNSESFVNLANKRVPKALKALELVGNLSNKSNYTYTEEQVTAIKKALKAKVNGAENLKMLDLTPTFKFEDDRNANWYFPQLSGGQEKG